MKTIDVTTFNGEHELFEIRYNVLKDVVDEFRVIEFSKTFSGKPKGMTFNQKWDKVSYFYITEDVWSRYDDLARSSPNTEYGKGAEHWIREFCQKESIKDCITDLKDNDLVFIGDVDEIWDWPLDRVSEPTKLRLKVYSYYLNNLSNEEFAGTLVAQYRDIKNECLNHIRANSPKTELYCGQHFTSIGGYEKVKQKLTDSYTPETYANPKVLDNLQRNINETHDFLGRNFTYIRDESGWPKWLKDNKDKYNHLLKP